MEGKKFQTADKLAFVHYLYDYCGRHTNGQVRSLFAQKMGVSERSFNNKMYSKNGFKGQELDQVQSLYRQVLGNEEFTQQLTLFLARASDGDYRTNENAANAAISDLTKQNTDMLTSHFLL
ncbi:hypothetical protein [Dyadobacter sp. 676]|uniref:Uncharacterized protein n=1 Tax=Dyadobacter sp. 676 TaxID=3088362 RepID=A0AAU8FK01_9BACT